MPRIRGFTLVEFLVVLLVVGLLLALLTPALSSMMAYRRSSVCINNLRQVGLLLQIYAGDHQDALPSGSPTVQWALNPVTRRAFPVGGPLGYSMGSYSLLFPDHWSDAGWSRALMCPGTPLFKSPSVVDEVRWGQSLLPFNLREFPQYYLSDAIAVDPACLRRDYRGKISGKFNRWSDIVFPAQKAVLYESTAFCLPTSEQRDWAVRSGRTYMWPTSVLAGDESVRRRPVVDSTARSGPEATLDTSYRTVDGVRGRDW